MSYLPHTDLLNCLHFEEISDRRKGQWHWRCVQQLTYKHKCVCVCVCVQEALVLPTKGFHTPFDILSVKTTVALFGGYGIEKAAVEVKSEILW